MLVAVDVSKVDGQSIFSWLVMVHIADSMRCQISLAVLVVGCFIFPFVQTYGILKEEQSLVWRQQRSESGRQV